MSKTKEDILFDHCPIYNPLFADEQTKQFRDDTLKAMDAYAAQCVEEFKEKLRIEVISRGTITASQMIILIEKL